MTPEEQKHFEDLIVKAVQSGKQETSGLVDMIMHKLESGIEDSINKNVNGKIKSLSEKVDNYIKTDNDWKDEVRPSLDVMEKMRVGSSILNWVAKTVILLAAVVGAIIGIKKLF